MERASSILAALTKFRIMTTTEHLQKIKAECERLLANSRDNGIDKYTEPAEAGWRSTIAAIDSITLAQSALLKISKLPQGYEGNAGADSIAEDCHFDIESAINQILAAWPTELLS